MFHRVFSLRNTSEIKSMFNGAMKLLEEKKIPEAIARFDEILVISPKHPRVLYNRGMAYYFTKNIDKAIYDLSLSSADSETKGIALFARGTIYSDLEENQKAIDDFNQVLNIDKTFGAVYLAKGTVYARLNQWNDAFQMYKEAILINYEADGDTYLQMANACLKLEKYDDALDNYEKCLEINPTEDEAHIGKSMMLFITGKTEAALDEVSTAIMIRPENPNGYAMRERIYRWMGEPAMADADKEKSDELKKTYDPKVRKGKIVKIQ